MAKRKRRLTKSQKGKQFEKEVERSLERIVRRPDGWFERIHDVQDFIGRSCPKCGAPISHCSHCGYHFPQLGCMPPRRMGDFHGVMRGEYFLVECKDTTWKKGFPTMNVKPHQLKSLQLNRMANGHSWIAIRRKVGMRQYTAHFVDVVDYSNLAVNKFTIPWSELEGVAVVKKRLPHEGKPFYSLDDGFLWNGQEGE